LVIVMPVRPCLLGCVIVAACSGCSKQEKPTAELLAELRGTSESQRISAARLLPQRRNQAADVIPALIAALRDKDDEVRRSAALGLGSFREQAKDAVPALRAALTDPDHRVREAAATALGRIAQGAAAKSGGSSRRE
jgi:HEAT repeat protein